MKEEMKVPILSASRDLIFMFLFIYFISRMPELECERSRWGDQKLQLDEYMYVRVCGNSIYVRTYVYGGKVELKRM